MFPEFLRGEPEAPQYKDSLLHFSSLTDNNIHYCKKQQWQVAVYVLGLYAAILTAVKGEKLPILPNFLPWIALVLVSVIALTGIQIIYKLQNSLRKFRLRQYRVLFEAKLIEAPEKNTPHENKFFKKHEVKNEEKRKKYRYSSRLENLDSFWRDSVVSITLFSAFSLGGLVVISGVLVLPDWENHGKNVSDVILPMLVFLLLMILRGTYVLDKQRNENWVEILRIMFRVGAVLVFTAIVVLAITFLG